MELKLVKTTGSQKEELGKLVDETKVTEAKIEKSLNYDNLTEEEKKAIDKFNSEIDVRDATQILQFGAPAQEKISKFSDTVLESVRTKDTGEVGDLLGNLVAEIKSFDKAVDDNSKRTLFEKMFSTVKKEFDKLVAKYHKIEKNIGTIENGLEKDKLQMLKDINLFDTMYEKNLEYFKEISLYIIAGEKKLDELKKKFKIGQPEEEEKIQESVETPVEQEETVVEEEENPVEETVIEESVEETPEEEDDDIVEMLEMLLNQVSDLRKENESLREDVDKLNAKLTKVKELKVSIGNADKTEKTVSDKRYVGKDGIGEI